MDFSGINKATARSFHAQQRLIKNVLMGKSELCSECNKPIALKMAAGLFLECPCAKVSIILDSEKLD